LLINLSTLLPKGRKNPRATSGRAPSAFPGPVYKVSLLWLKDKTGLFLMSSHPSVLSLVSKKSLIFNILFRKNFGFSKIYANKNQLLAKIMSGATDPW
jgi:hypothetical protein